MRFTCAGVSRAIACQDEQKKVCEMPAFLIASYYRTGRQMIMPDITLKLKIIFQSGIAF